MKTASWCKALSSKKGLLRDWDLKWKDGLGNRKREERKRLEYEQEYAVQYQPLGKYFQFINIPSSRGRLYASVF